MRKYCPKGVADENIEETISKHRLSCQPFGAGMCLPFASTVLAGCAPESNGASGHA